VTGMILTILHAGNISFSGNYRLECLPGGQFFNKSSAEFLDNFFSCITYQSDSLFQTFQALDFRCSNCPAGSYNLLPDYSNSATPFTCYPCPEGADCSRGGSDVYALSNYFCNQWPNNSALLQCARCPTGYCPSNVRPWNQSCIESHKGVLCGS